MYKKRGCRVALPPLCVWMMLIVYSFGTISSL